MRPEELLEEAWPYLDLSPEDRGRLMHAVCATSMRQWLSLPEEKRLRRPPEPGTHGEAILRRWAEEFRERSASRR